MLTSAVSIRRVNVIRFCIHLMVVQVQARPFDLPGKSPTRVPPAQWPPLGRAMSRDCFDGFVARAMGQTNPPPAKSRSGVRRVQGLPQVGNRLPAGLKVGGSRFSTFRFLPDQSLILRRTCILFRLRPGKGKRAACANTAALLTSHVTRNQSAKKSALMPCGDANIAVLS